VINSRRIRLADHVASMVTVINEYIILI